MGSFGKKRGFFDFEDEFDRMRKEMERMFEDAFSEPFGEEETKQYGPYVYGFSMKVGPDGKPVVREFGNVKPRLKGMKDEIDPLVDVIEGKDKITVIAELPGVNKEDIKLNCTGSNLSIKVDSAQRKYNKAVELPARVKTDSAKANYKNGVLEVCLTRVAPKKEDKRRNISIG